MKNIFAYQSVREFLSDRFRHEKIRGMTLATFAAQFELSGPMFKMIMKGTRNLSVYKAHDIARLFQMTHEEQEYMEALLLSEQAPAAHRGYYEKRLAQIKETVRAQLQTAKTETTEIA